MLLRCLVLFFLASLCMSIPLHSQPEEEVHEREDGTYPESAVESYSVGNVSIAFCNPVCEESIIDPCGEEYDCGEGYECCLDLCLSSTVCRLTNTDDLSSTNSSHAEQPELNFDLSGEANESDIFKRSSSQYDALTSAISPQEYHKYNPIEDGTFLNHSIYTEDSNSTSSDEVPHQTDLFASVDYQDSEQTEEDSSPAYTDDGITVKKRSPTYQDETGGFPHVPVETFEISDANPQVKDAFEKQDDDQVVAGEVLDNNGGDSDNMDKGQAISNSELGTNETTLFEPATEESDRIESTSQTENSDQESSLVDRVRDRFESLFQRGDEDGTRRRRFAEGNLEKVEDNEDNQEVQDSEEGHEVVEKSEGYQEVGDYEDNQKVQDPEESHEVVEVESEGHQEMEDYEDNQGALEDSEEHQLKDSPEVTDDDNLNLDNLNNGEIDNSEISSNATAIFEPATESGEDLSQTENSDEESSLVDRVRDRFHSLFQRDDENGTRRRRFTEDNQEEVEISEDDPLADLPDLDLDPNQPPPTAYIFVKKVPGVSLKDLVESGNATITKIVAPMPETHFNETDASDSLISDIEPYDDIVQDGKQLNTDNDDDNDEDDHFYNGNDNDRDNDNDDNDNDYDNDDNDNDYDNDDNDNDYDNDDNDNDNYDNDNDEDNDD